MKWEAHEGRQRALNLALILQLIYWACSVDCPLIIKNYKMWGSWNPALVVERARELSIL